MSAADRTWNNSAFIMSAVSIPSRVIMSSVNPNTPRNAPVPALRVDARSFPSISSFMRRPARHICTVSDATMTAATIASTPSQSA